MDEDLQQQPKEQMQEQGQQQSQQQCITASAREPNETELEALARQDVRPVSSFRAQKFQSESNKHWNLFYKRNGARFFKDRHWTRREFEDLSAVDTEKPFTLLEVGCGVGNFIFPLLEECGEALARAFACDFSEVR